MLLYSVKNGKVVVLLNGRFAGRKAIVVKTFDEGRGDRKFGHAIGTTLYNLIISGYCHWMAMSERGD